MRKTSLAVVALCVGLLWLGEARAARFETHATNAKVPEGTVYDTTTGLLWEIKSPAGADDVHDVRNDYSWSIGGTGIGPSDGTVFTSFLASLNGGDYYDPSLGLVVNSNPTSCFATHCDWRLPSVAELAGIVDRRFPDNRYVDPVFGPNQLIYWSTTTAAGSPNNAWEIVFSAGGVVRNDPKNSVGRYARAVRSGL